VTPINIQRQCAHSPDAFKRRATERLSVLRGIGPGKVRDLNAVWDARVLKCDVTGRGPYERDLGILGKPSGLILVQAILYLTRDGRAVLSGAVTARGDWESKAEAETLTRLEALMNELVSN